MGQRRLYPCGKNRTPFITQIVLAEAINKVDEARIGFENAVYEYFAVYYDWEMAAGAAAPQ
jgi:hypothetical protein